MIVFNLRKNYATAFISKQKAIVLTNLKPESKAFKYLIQPALDQHKIKEIVCINDEKDSTKKDDR